MQQVITGAAKAELGALFLNAQTACPICMALDEMGHAQLATLLQTNNSAACGIIKDTMKQKCSKAIDMHFYWIHDQACQGQFTFFGTLVTPIVLIISPNIIQPNIIKPCSTPTCNC